jgi:hypothetical protein
VPEDERDGKHTIGLMLLWWSVNTVVSTFPIGVSHTTMCPLLVLTTRTAPCPGLLHHDL